MSEGLLLVHAQSNRLNRRRVGRVASPLFLTNTHPSAEGTKVVFFLRLSSRRLAGHLAEDGADEDEEQDEAEEEREDFEAGHVSSGGGETLQKPQRTPHI